MTDRRSMFFNSTSIAWQRVLLALLLAEFLIFVLSGVSFSFLHGAVFFNYGVDFFFGIFYFTSLPQLIVAHHWLGIMADVSILLLLIWLIKNPQQNRVALLLAFLMLLYYLTLMGYLNHRNFHTGFVLVLFPYLFRSIKARHFGYEACRYFLLFFYASAAFFKILYGSFTHMDHLSVNIAKQFAPYFTEGNTGIRTTFNAYLVNHASLGYVLLILSLLAELMAVAGFFTKRWDKMIGLSLLLFHFVNWFIMDLAPFGQISFISLLFVRRAFPDSK